MKYDFLISIKIKNRPLNFPTSTCAKFEKILQNFNFSKKVFISPYATSISISFDNIQDINYEKNKEIYDRVLEEIKIYTNEIEDSYHYIKIELDEDKIQIINSAIEYNGNIRLFLNNKNISLSGIHKFIKKCNTLDIFWASNITSSILGLLIIKTSKTLLYVNESKPEWLSIVNKYLSQHSNDVLECQEELIENGFKELAKL